MCKGTGHAHHFMDQVPSNGLEVVFHLGFSEALKDSEVRLLVWKMNFPLAPDDPLLTSFTLNCTAGHSDQCKLS